MMTPRTILDHRGGKVGHSAKRADCCGLWHFGRTVLNLTAPLGDQCARTVATRPPAPAVVLESPAVPPAGFSLSHLRNFYGPVMIKGRMQTKAGTGIPRTPPRLKGCLGGVFCVIQTEQ
jgi:hypothetical protein